jgi:hypothetical protein
MIQSGNPNMENFYQLLQRLNSWMEIGGGKFGVFVLMER